MSDIFYCPDTKSYWERCVALVDMMAFFPSCEQLDFPELRNKPVGVTNGDKGTTIISSSYEARKYGVRTGMRIYDAQKICPNIIKRPSRPERYAQISKQIMLSLMNITPDISVYSIDECYIDLKPVLNLYKSVQKIADMIRETVFKSSGGIVCSIGISEGQLTAKYCASKNKGKTTIVSPDKIKEFIGQAKVGTICGIGKSLEKYLNSIGVYYCKDLEKYPASILTNKNGDIGRRLYMTCLGHDPIKVDVTSKDSKSMGHGKLLPGETSISIIKSVMRVLVERLSRRMRESEVVSNKFYIGFKTVSGWNAFKYAHTPATNITNDIWKLILKHFCHYGGEHIYQVQITAISLTSSRYKQYDLFEDFNKEEVKNKNSVIDSLKDQINKKYGKGTVKSAIELESEKANMVPVISFNFDAKGKNSL